MQQPRSSTSSELTVCQKKLLFPFGILCVFFHSRHLMVPIYVYDYIYKHMYTKYLIRSFRSLLFFIPVMRSSGFESRQLFERKTNVVIKKRNCRNDRIFLRTRVPRRNIKEFNKHEFKRPKQI